MTIIIEHNNGVEGQYGFSEEAILNLDEIKSLVRDYAREGIRIYKITILQPSL